MSTLWGNVTEDHIKQAIQLFETQTQNHSKAINTFLLYENKSYPAKHIRGLAYQIANGREISTDDYNGGAETATFLRNLGFTVNYRNSNIPTQE